MMDAQAASMDAMQQILVDRHGSVAEPLRGAGLSGAVIEQLRSRLVEAHA
jgi:hypothetical protein